MIRPLTLPDTSEPRHDPSSWLRLLVESRDQRCTGVGCRRPARLCDLDHELEHAKGGPTSEPNLDAESRRCHLARHHGWTAVRDRRSGITTWTSPDDSRYQRLPAWVRHPSHEPVVRLGLHLTELPTAQSDYPDDRPLWRPPTVQPPRPSVQGSKPLTARDLNGSRGWDDGPPPF